MAKRKENDPQLSLKDGRLMSHVERSANDFLVGLRMVDVQNVKRILACIDSNNSSVDGISIGVIAVGSTVSRPEMRKQFPRNINLKVHTSSLFIGEEDFAARDAAVGKLVDGLKAFCATNGLASEELATETHMASGTFRNPLLVITPEDGLPIHVGFANARNLNYDQYLKVVERNPANKFPFAVLI